MEIIQTVCGNCAQSDCGMDVYVEAGKIVKIRGTPNHPYSHGYLCAKGLASGDLVSDPNRVKRPLKRVGKRGENKWAEISWNEALDIIAEKLLKIKAEYGPEAVSLVRGTGPGWQGSLMYHKRFMNAFGSGNICCGIHGCKGIRVSVTGTMMGGEPDLDIENTKTILLWGSNPAVTSLPNYWNRISKAKSLGTKLIVIDPRFNNVASKADIHLPVRPGTDGALALGFAHVIIKEKLYDEKFVTNYGHGFEEYRGLTMEYPPERVEQITGISADKICEVARIYGGNKPSLILVGNGVEELTNAMQTMRAIYCLPGLVGNTAVKGGHILPKPLSFSDVALNSKFMGELLERSVSQFKFYQSKLGLGATVTWPDIYDAIRTDKPYPIKALLNMGVSFLTVLPEGDKYRDLIRDKMDLIVVHDPFMTRESKELADIVLPGTTFLECWRLRFMRPGFKGNAYIQWVALARPVVQPVGQSRSDEEFLSELAKRVGIGEYFPWKNVLEFTDEALKPMGTTAKELVEQPEGKLWKIPEEEVIRFYEKAGFNTPTKKFEFYNTTFEKAGFDPLPRFIESEESPVSRPDLYKDYPLICDIGIKTMLFSSTQFHSLPLLRDYTPEPWVEIHPLKAKEMGIENGDKVRVKTTRGQVELNAKITEAVMNPNTIFMPYCWEGINNLTTIELRDPICGSTPNHGLLCRIEKSEGRRG